MLPGDNSLPNTDELTVSPFRYSLNDAMATQNHNRHMGNKQFETVQIFENDLTYLLTYVLTYLHNYLLNYLLLNYLLITYVLTYLITYLLIYILTYLLTHSLTPWCRVLVAKLTGLQVVKKFPAFH